MALLKRRSDKVEVLEKVPLFRALNKKHLDQVARHVDEVTVPKGQVLAEEGTMGYEFFVILEGQVTVKRKGRKLATLGKGDFFGEMALLDQEPRSATVVAERQSTLAVIHRREFLPLVDEVPGLARHLMAGLAQRLRKADQQLVG